MKNKLYNLAIALAAICLWVALALSLSGNVKLAGRLYIAFFILLAIGFNKTALLKGFAYTLCIFASIIAALCYPQYFVEYNGFHLSKIVTPLIQLIMFGMGTSISLGDFARVIKMPKGVFIGVFSRFLIMPLIGYILANLSGLPPEITAGIILTGCSPNGMTSNVISYLAKANLALSITITVVSALLAPLIMPLLMRLFAGFVVHISVTDMMWDITKMMILPITTGLAFNNFLSEKARWLDSVMRFVSMFGIAVIIVIMTAGGRNSLFNIGPLLILLVLIHNLLGYLSGYWMGRLFKISKRDCRTIAIDAGMPSGGLASGLTGEMGKIATSGLAPAVFNPLMNITGALLATWWRRKTQENNTPGSAPYKFAPD